jgi:hypothetical protein
MHQELGTFYIPINRAKRKADETLKAAIYELLRRKKEGQELDREARIPVIGSSLRPSWRGLAI